MPSWVSRVHTQCRVCSAPLGSPYLDLGEQPLANALCDPLWMTRYDTPEDRFPLQVILCEQCGLSQLSVVVNPEILYSRSYPFHSGVSGLWRAHCDDLAEKASLQQKPGRALDIAANDGTQLAFLEKWGWRVVGVEPAQVPLVDLGARPYEQRPDFPMLRRFWSQQTADMILAHRGEQDLVIAQNVLGHVDDPISFLKAIKTVLAPEGRVVVEVPYAERMRADCAFDTIYHEHLSYWTHTAMEWAAYQAGLYVDHIERVAIHGGSSRYWMQHRTGDCGDPPTVGDGPIVSAVEYTAFAQRVEENLNATQDIIVHCDIAEIGSLIGWGASAKAAVYLNAIAARDPSALPSAVIDDCAEKQGMLMPGVHIPIIACPESLADVDVLWLLSWNNSAALKEKAKARGFVGKFLLTNGTPRLEE